MIAPERIWTTGLATGGSWNSTKQTSTRIDWRETEYVRADLYAAQAARIDALHSAQTYTYIGKDGKSVLARDLEDERDSQKARIAELMAALWHIMKTDGHPSYNAASLARSALFPATNNAMKETE